MSTIPRLPPTLRRYGLQALALVLFGVAIWLRWPLDSVSEDGFVLLEALFGLACVLGPDEVVQYGSLRGQGYSSYTAREARTLEEADLVVLAGFLLLLDALTGLGEWLIWTWM